MIEQNQSARRFVVVRSVAALAALAGTVALAQQTPPVCPQGNATMVRNDDGKLVADPRCTTAGPPPSAARRFPFPGENDAAPATNQPPSSTTTQPAATPETPAAPSAPTSAPAGKRFPYPGETSEGSQPAGSSSSSSSSSNPPLQDEGSSGTATGSSSSSSSSSAKPDNDDSDPDDPAAVPRFKKRKQAPVAHKSTSEREQEDVQVAGFYQNDGNYMGAYARAKDAVSLDAEDPAAYVALGEAARKLGKLDEAEKAFKRCLDLDPVPKLRRSAERALKEMTGGGS